MEIEETLVIFSLFTGPHRGAKKEKKETKGKKKEFQARRNEKNYGGGAGEGRGWAFIKKY